MKRTITTEIFAIASQYSQITPEMLRSGDVASQLIYSTSKMTGMDGYSVVGKGTITVELDSVEDVTAAQVASLREQLKAVRADAQSKVNRLEDQIRNLQALTFQPANDELAA